MVGALIFLPWDLNEFDLEAGYSTLHFLQVLFHPLVSTLKIAIDLTSYHLGVTIYDHVSGARGPCKI